MKKVLLVGPVLSMSGYGEQARFALKALHAFPERFQVFAQNVPWGSTGWIQADSEERSFVDDVLGKTHVYLQQGGQIDMTIQVGIPNEFKQMAQENICYTAGIETTKIAPEWVQKSQEMNKIITISEHSRYGFENTQYPAIAKNNQTGEEQEVTLKVECPVEVVNYAFMDEQADETFDINLDYDFNFLSVAQWGPRKNVQATLLNFLKEFKDEEVGLVMKVNFAKNNVRDRMVCESRLRSILSQHKDRKCKVYLLHGNLTKKEMKSLYTHPKIKAFVSTTHGEGFGLPLFEAAGNGLPVIAPNWSGHLDFLYVPTKDKKGKVKNKAHFTKISYDLQHVQPEVVWKGVIVADSNWAYVKDFSVRDTMRDVYKNYNQKLALAKKLQKHIQEEFTIEKKYEEFANAVYQPSAAQEKWTETIGEVSED